MAQTEIQLFQKKKKKSFIYVKYHSNFINWICFFD